jgi:hypothetical protein
VISRFPQHATDDDVLWIGNAGEVGDDFTYRSAGLPDELNCNRYVASP